MLNKHRLNLCYNFFFKEQWLSSGDIRMKCWCRSSFCPINHHLVWSLSTAVFTVWSTNSRNIACELSNSLSILKLPCCSLPPPPGRSDSRVSCSWTRYRFRVMIKRTLLQGGCREVMRIKCDTLWDRGWFLRPRGCSAVILLKGTPDKLIPRPPWANK